MVYCITCVQRIDQKAFLDWLYQYLSFLNIFFNRFCPVCGSIKKLFLIDCVNIYLFSIFFFNRFCPVGKAFLDCLCQYFYLFSIFFFNIFCPVEKAVLNWLCQYLSFFNIFFNWFCPVEKCGATLCCLYCDSLTLIDHQTISASEKNKSITHSYLW